MNDRNRKEPKPSQKASEAPPELPMDFYLKLLSTPPCEKNGICVGCGQCHFNEQPTSSR